MSSPARALPADIMLFKLIQQENQRQILGKLLHDLRNPVHSIRISMELFGRLARRSGDLDKLMERAAAYIGPAEAALDNLLANSERLCKYLTAPVAAEIAPTPLHELLSETAMLLRASRRRPQVACTLPESDAALKVHADRARLSHLLLHCCLSNMAASVRISAYRAANDLVCIDLAFQGKAVDDGAGSPPLAAEELRLLVETAGGTVAGATGSGLSLRFKCWSEPLPPG